LQPALSYCHGAGAKARLKAIFRRILWASFVMAVAAFLFMELAGSYMAGLFSQNEGGELRQFSKDALTIFAFSYLAGWMDLCFSSYFTALDMPGRSLLLSFVGTLVLPAALLAPIYGLLGIWLMPPIASLFSGILALFLYRNSQSDLTRKLLISHS
jgi:Na+-driven multidrug efflux pump